MTMRRHPFTRSLIFAAVVSAALPVVLLALGPPLGTGRVLALYLVGTASGHVAELASGWRQSIAGALFVALGGGLLVASLPGFGPHAMAQLAIGCALLIALCRSLLFHRGRPLRGLLLECGLTLGGLLCALLLAGPGPASMAAALWAYLLVQSLFHLAPAPAVRVWTETGGDCFERARTRLLALLEESS